MKLRAAARNPTNCLSTFCPVLVRGKRIYRHSVSLDGIVSHHQHHSDDTGEFIHNSPPSKMRKQIATHIRCNRCRKRDNPANLKSVSAIRTRARDSYRCDGYGGEEEWVADDVACCPGTPLPRLHLISLVHGRVRRVVRHPPTGNTETRMGRRRRRKRRRLFQ